MAVKIKLNKKEKKEIKEKDKTVLVRPRNEKFKNLKKGDSLVCEDFNLLVVDIRNYPRITDLMKLENRAWIPTNVGDIVEAIKEYTDLYKSENDNGDEFLAIDFAIQE